MLYLLLQCTTGSFYNTQVTTMSNVKDNVSTVVQCVQVHQDYKKYLHEFTDFRAVICSFLSAHELLLHNKSSHHMKATSVKTTVSVQPSNTFRNRDVLRDWITGSVHSMPTQQRCRATVGSSPRLRPSYITWTPFVLLHCLWAAGTSVSAHTVWYWFQISISGTTIADKRHDGMHWTVWDIY